HPRFVPDLIVACAIALLLCEPGILAHAADRPDRLSGNLSAVGASLLLDIPLAGCFAILILDENISRRMFAAIAAVLAFVLLPIGLSLGARGAFLGAAAALAVIILRRAGRPRAGRAIAGILVAMLVAGAIASAILLSGDNTPFVRGATRIVANFVPDGSVTL